MYLTKRQKEILDHITDHVHEYGYAPTLEEIGAAFGLSSPATVYKHVSQLVDKGYLRRAKHQGRGLQLVDAEAQRSIEIPVLGQIVAGRAVEALRPPATVSLPPSFASKLPLYGLRIHGNSFLDELLADGDLLVVEDRIFAQDGETVVAMLHENLTAIGRYYREHGHIRLQPQRTGREPVYVEDTQVRIRGIVIGVIRHCRAQP